MSLDLAIRHALKNPIKSKGRTSISRFGAILTDGWRTYYGWNSYKSHPLQAKFAEKVGEPHKIHIHCEISALSQALYPARIGFFDMEDAKMYIARVLADGTPALAKPCEGCMSAITEFGLKKIYWTE